MAANDPDSLDRIINESSGVRRIDAMIALAELYKVRNESMQTENLYRTALAYISNEGDQDTAVTRRRLKIMIRLSDMMLFEKASYHESTPLLLDALVLASRMKDKRSEGLICIYLGFNYRFLGKYITAARFLDEAISLTQVTGDTSRLISAMNERANVCFYTGDTVQSRKLHHQALALAVTTGNQHAQNYISHDLALMYMRHKEYRRALSFFLINFNGMTREADPRQVAISAINIADAYLNLGEIDSSFIFLNIADSIVRRNRLNHERIVVYEKLSDYYARKSIFDKAYLYLMKFHQLTDSTFNLQKERQISELTRQYELDRKDQEKELLKHQYRNTVIIGLITAVLLLFILILLLHDRNRRRLINRELEKRNENTSRRKDNLEVAFEVLRKKEKQLEEANSSKDTFFSIIAHDLRSPFHALLAFSEILLQSHRRIHDDEREEMIRVVNDSAGNLYKLLENLLEWTRTQTNRVEVKPESFPMERVIDKNVELLTPLATKKEIQITHQPCDSCMTFADQGMIDFVIRNLLSNAIKYVHRGGMIIIRTQISSEGILLSVMDNGVGIPPEDLKKLFRIDSKIKTPGTEMEKGTGLGLTICKEFIEKNLGRIWVESEEGKGSTFYVLLPPANE